MLLLRGATRRARWDSNYINVSIHAPLARSNHVPSLRPAIRKSFNTCSSCEEQRSGEDVVVSHDRFQYMLLLRGATTLVSPCALRMRVSIHAPLARSNGVIKLVNVRPEEFQYMLLLRGATRVPYRGRARHGSFNTCSSCEEQPATPDQPSRR